MKTGTKIGIIVGIVLVLLMCCCIGGAGAWYFMAGPGSYQRAEADKLISVANEKYAKAYNAAGEMKSSATDLGKQMPDEVSTTFLETFKDDVSKLESKAQENIDDLDSADKDLAAAKRLRLPDWYNGYIDTLSRRNEAMRTGLEALQKAFSESRKMMGSLAYVIDGVERITTGFMEFDEIMTSIAASDYAGGLAKINEANASLLAGETALATANESMDSQDVRDMIALSAKFREILPLMTSFIQAAQVLDIATMTALQPQLTTKLNEASAAADAAGASEDSRLGLGNRSRNTKTNSRQSALKPINWTRKLKLCTAETPARRRLRRGIYAECVNRGREQIRIYCGISRTGRDDF